MSFVIGVDLGGTKILAVAADLNGNVYTIARAETRAHEGGDTGVEQIARAVEEACRAIGKEPKDALALGIGSPGPLDLEKGLIVHTPNLPWGIYPIRDRLSARLGGTPVTIDNDCKVGGLGEFRFGAGKGSRTMVYFGVGTGIGGCVIVDGQIQYGASGNASEVGHMVVWMDGPVCGCGTAGCVEAVASGSGLTRRARELVRSGRGAALLQIAGTVDAVDAGTVARAAAAGDPEARRLWEQGIQALGIGAANMMTTLSPEVIVLGGGVVEKNGEAYVDAVAAAARKYAFGPNAEATRIVPAALADESALRGAVALALAKINR